MSRIVDRREGVAKGVSDLSLPIILFWQEFIQSIISGHCIGVDPYYLAQKAQEYGYHPEIILAGRRLNDNIGRYVASQVIKLMIARDHKIKGAKVLVLGITFKENCPDIRNTKVVDIVKELHQYGAQVDIFDPWANPQEVRHQYGLESHSALNGNHYQAIILAVAHNQFKALNLQDLASNQHCVIYDIKGILPQNQVAGRL